MTVSGGASQTAVEAHWDALTAGGYTRAGDHTSDFSPADATNGVWELLATGGAPELGFIKLANTGSGTVEVHLDTLSGTSYTRVADYTSHFSPADAHNGVWQLFGSSGGAPELGFIKLRNTPGTVEVHWETLQAGVYTDAGDYTSDFSPGDALNGTWQLVPTGGAPELGFVKLLGTGSGKVEVHLDTLTAGSYRRVGDHVSDFSPADAGNGIWQLVGSSGGAPELGLVKLRNTGSGTVEVHLDALGAGGYTRVGDYTSDFSPADAVNGAFGLFGAPGATPELGFVKTFPLGSPVVPRPVNPAPVQPVVQTQTLLPPAVGGHRRHRSVRARFVLGWTWNHRRTRLHRVLVTGVPRDGRMAVRCRGRGCPESAVSARYHGIGGLLRSLEGQVFRAGDVVTITVAAPGRRAERIALRIRDGREPAARLL
ncbi:MAG TPA: hypothetical protein VG275_10720 [Solirubrobacteraceae bacterium]|nr:hypothetical protein [Solirubrobacteraceae bacterium]